MKNPDNSNINVHEVEAILLAFQVCAPSWEGQRFRVFTDSTTVFSGLYKYILKGPPNAPLQKIWLLAAKWNIVIEPYWIKKKRNGLVDTLSYFDKEKLIHMCLHWQNPLQTTTLQPSTYLPSLGQQLSNA